MTNLMASKEGSKLIPYTIEKEIFKERREFLGLSRLDLAKKIGYGKAMVGHVERGHNKGSDQFLEKASDALFLTPKCLLKVLVRLEVWSEAIKS